MLALAPSAARAAESCASAPVAGGHTVQLQVGPLARSALVHVPRGIPSAHHAPLVIALHGSGGSGRGMEHYSGFSHAADQHRFIAVYPNTVGPVWNRTASAHGADDVGFVSALITDLEQTQCIDSQRVFVAGVSNGGGMAALLGCALSARLRAIAPVAGAYDGQPPCRVKRAVSVLEVHGTADGVAPYFGAGGHTSSKGPPAFVRAWARRDSCASVPTERQVAARADLFRWDGCAGGSSVEHLRIVGGAHQWPGALPPDPGPHSTICTACLVWSFFSSLPLRGQDSSSGGAGLPG